MAALIIITFSAVFVLLSWEPRNDDWHKLRKD